MIGQLRQMLRSRSWPGQPRTLGVCIVHRAGKRLGRPPVWLALVWRRAVRPRAALGRVDSLRTLHERLSVRHTQRQTAFAGRVLLRTRATSLVSRQARSSVRTLRLFQGPALAPGLPEPQLVARGERHIERPLAIRIAQTALEAPPALPAFTSELLRLRVSTLRLRVLQPRAQRAPDRTGPRSITTPAWPSRARLASRASAGAPCRSRGHAAAFAHRGAASSAAPLRRERRTSSVTARRPSAGPGPALVHAPIGALMLLRSTRAEDHAAPAPVLADRSPAHAVPFSAPVAPPAAPELPGIRAQPAATSLFGRVELERLADDVMRRIDRRARIERERRGI